MNKLNDLRLSKSMKYTALYIAMRFFEHAPDIYEKIYPNGTYIKIDSANQVVYINDNKVFKLVSHKSFVKLEYINRLLMLGYSINDFSLSEDSSIFNGFNVEFITWDDPFDENSLKDKQCRYKSRLVSGVLEYKTKIKDVDIFEHGLFEEKGNIKLRKQVINFYTDKDFIIEENKVVKYIGKAKIVVVPDGIEELESAAFWDNQYIEEVVLPESLKNMGGDTFYNCKKLKIINIPASVELMGNNPFAGCPLIKITNYSKHFIIENGALYTSDKKALIYCPINGDETFFVIPEGVTIICKHAFFLCDRFTRITLPSSLEKMENNPFSGCSKLELLNNSKSYYIYDDVIYNRFKTSVVGALNKIKSKRLILLDGIKTINRNSFWNCKGIECIVFPKSLNDIGYNPFVGCSNIHFESKSPYYNVVDGVLYNEDRSKIICYPAWKAVGHVKLLDSVITLERGAFSGCDKMTGIDLHNVNIVSKSCFTNCFSLKKLYCSDLLTYIGVWAFAYCSSLKEVSIYNDTVVDDNAFSNTHAELIRRRNRTNYVIESENLKTLISMKGAYKGKIDSILIDPPYNSHIDYIGYKDSYYEDSYLKFIGERISISKELLSDFGFLIINIDEGESMNLFKLSKLIFGESCVTLHKWKKKHKFFDNNRVILNPNKKQTDYEYVIICRKKANMKLGKLMQPYIQDGILFEKEADVPEIFDCFGTTSSAKDEICALFGKRDFFSTPKPLKLIKEFVRMTTKRDSIVMDFFAGSGTVGHAVVDLNKEDGGNRKFILISNSESNICKNVTVRRMKKIGADFILLD